MSSRSDKTHTPDQPPKRYSSPAVEQAGRILFCLARNPAPQMSLAEICSEVNVSESKAFGILDALQKSGLAKRGKDGKGYALGPGLVILSRKVLDDLAPAQLAEPLLEELTRETGCTSVYGSIEGKNIQIMAHKEAQGTVSVVMRVGRVMPLTYGAHGRAIVAFLSQKERGRILESEDLHFHISPDRLDRDRLEKELAQCRSEGFATDFGESAQGVNVVTAPVIGPAAVPVGIIEIFVLASPETAYRLGPTVARTARALSRQLGAPEMQ